MKGLDCAYDCRGVLRSIVAGGFQFVERYVGIGGLAKRLTPAEAGAILGAGLDIVSVAEAWGAEHPSDVERFSGEAGREHGRRVLADLKVLGQPKGSAIYFAVDGDVSEEDLQRNILPYFEGLRETFGPAAPWKLRAYGSGLLGATLQDAGLIDHFQIANARGWRGFEEFAGRAVLRQGPTGVFGNHTFDYDEGVGDIGGWSGNGAQQGGAPAEPISLHSDIIEAVKVLQTQLRNYPSPEAPLYGGAVDGLPGARTRQALADFEREMVG